MLSSLILLAGAAVARADNYAVLVAGSNTYANYRHQADVCHAYQIVKKNGVPEDNIIVMSYNDVAKSFSNPFQGKLFNAPTDEGVPGVDVNDGCNIDYEGAKVNKDNFMKVLTGDASAGGKVLTSGPDDKVFINFVDHGGVGLIAMPTGGYIYKDDLNKTLQAMVDKKMFSELVFYMEACESGSMFEDVLPDNVKIYATTAANGQESSWGTYCPPSDKVDGKSLNTCLGDLYSVNWMEDADQASTTESLDDQYDIVKNETTKSHVMKFGEPDMGTDKADGFWGKIAARATSTPKMSVAQKEMSAIDSRDVKLHTLYSMYLTSDAKDTFAKSKAAKALIEEIQSREMYDKLFNEIATRTMASNNGLADEAVNGYRKPTQHQCHRTVNEAFEAKCGRLSDYALKYVRVVVNLCEITKSPETIVAALEGLC